jgi:hypothetical protein
VVAVVVHGRAEEVVLVVPFLMEVLQSHPEPIMLLWAMVAQEMLAQVQVIQQVDLLVVTHLLMVL